MPAAAKVDKKAPKKRYNRKRYPKKNLSQYQVKAVARKEATRVVAGRLETKHLYDGLADINLSTTAIAELLTTMTIGVQDNEIIGTKCRLTSLYIKYHLTLADDTNFVRLIVFQDKHQNLTTPSFQAQMFVPSSGSPITAPYNVDNVPSRYAILYDKVVSLDQDDPTYYGSIVIKKFPRQVLEFNGNPTTVTGIASGHLYFMMVSDSIILNHPRITWDSALFFKDG